MDIHTYDREAEDIDEIQKEDRQERMAKQKARLAHIKYLRHEASIADKASPCINKASLEVEDD